MLVSMSLIDRLSGVMDPEELPQLSDVRASQASVAGLTLDVRVRILEAAAEVPAAMGVCARWDAAVAAAEGLPCAPWDGE